MKTILLALVILFPTYLLAQNLVSNHDFETYSNCPKSLGEVKLATSWSCPNAGTPDYFNDCSSSLDFGTEFNKKGGQIAHSGHGYAGFQSEVLNRNEFFEYLETSLTEPLVADSMYCIRMYVSQGTSTVSLRDIGVAFSQVELKNLPATKIRIPFVHVGNGGVLSDSTHWMCITGNYKARGGERYLTIGDFSPADDFIDSRENKIFQIAYYFVDDVWVFMMPDQNACLCKP